MTNYVIRKITEKSLLPSPLDSCYVQISEKFRNETYPVELILKDMAVFDLEKLVFDIMYRGDRYRIFSNGWVLRSSETHNDIGIMIEQINYYGYGNND